MEIDILQQPDSSIAKVTLSANEELIAEAGAMIAMSDFLNVSTKPVHNHEAIFLTTVFK